MPAAVPPLRFKDQADVRRYVESAEVPHVKVGFTDDDPYEDPTYTSYTFTIGSDFKVDALISGRYISIRFETGSAYQWRLDSLDILLEVGEEF